ncbi:MAG: patatin-like phospholipase family protein [Gemmatimonadetes bacterium]|nr:patatin-like phospholipase family protein [Gemmatimonadota bacterium]NNK64462.1 patatin [Gemmatimonadota bacterium]
MSDEPPRAEITPLTTASSGPGPRDLGIVMGGGGARAAYQVGFLRAVARRYPNLEIPYVTGVSAGGINAAHVAAHHGSFKQAIEELTRLWGDLSMEHVFRTDSVSLGRQVFGTLRGLASGGHVDADRLRGLVDTAPLREFLREALHTVDGEITGIAYNLARGRLKAAALSTSSYSTGQSVTWVQGENIQEWERPVRRSRNTVLTVDHVMASAALPLFFPAIQLPGGWYGDGGIRLTAPLSPALHLGARRILAISTRYAPSLEEADRPAIQGYPPPAQIIGVLMNAVFLDLMDQDAMRLERLNGLLEQLEPEERMGLRPVKLMVLRPSIDLGRLAGQYEPRLPRVFRFLTRGLGTRATESPDFLSLILFQPDYLNALIETGERDAEMRAGEIEAFLSD